MSFLPSSNSLRLRDIVACLGFYTRLPVNAQSERPLALAQWAAPVAGLVVGLIAGVVGWLLWRAGVPGTIAAAFILAASIALTGALHEDGLADIADGFGGGREREQKLVIMKDSRIGTYGVLALALSVLVRWSALVALLAASGLVTLLTLIAAHAASRALIPWFMATVPPARPDGLSASVGRIDSQTATIALIVGVACLLPLGYAVTAVSILLLGAVFFFLRWLTLRQIGGQTGDVLGALQQGGEIAILVAAATLLT
jgi:adenosylcobinamide-GDP ribazoletransferase